MTHSRLAQAIDSLAAQQGADRDAVVPLIEELLAGLEAGEIRAARPQGEDWIAEPWVKRGILLAFRCGRDVDMSGGDSFHFRDRDLLPTLRPGRGVRIVPGGSTVRRGAFLGSGVVMMPPAYVNVGAYVGERSMVDSHALVGSCAQIGVGVHLSAAAQVGGVLEPAGALPVIVEDDVFVGGGCGIYEGARVRAGAVLAPGTILTRAVPVHDLVHDRIIRAEDGVLTIPELAVVVPGSRPVGDGKVHLQTPVIVKYRDASTDASLSLEEALR